ncbi:MAG: protein translocase subunit SecF [Alphaproteobacteria bacterium]|nr:protein translocase subunit SecF [Alphaproteobacteria bacterium]
MKSLSFIPQNTQFDFIGIRWIAFIVSITMVLGTFALVGVKGLNLGIDFTGGTLIEIRTEQPADLADLRQTLNNLDLGSVSIQEFGAPEDLMIRIPEQKAQDGVAPEDIQKQAVEVLKSTLTEKLGTVDIRRVEYVGPQVGEELKSQAFWAIVFALAGILIYVGFRFEWQFGVAAILALLHDVISIVGFYALFGLNFDLTAVACVLMIAGYSINDTVVIFDRIRETIVKHRKMPLPDLLNRAINDTLSRTIVTGITTLLALLALWLFGGEVIREFVNAMLFGVLLGTYSSVFMAAPILLYLRIRRTPSDSPSAS